jgi:hypothetical protein
MRVIGEMIEHVRKNHAAPVVLLTRDREELENPRRSEGWRGDLRELVTQMEAPSVDMLVRFRAEPDRGLGAFRDEVHPNERGNRLIGHAAAEQILALRAAGALTPERAPAAR